MGLAPETAGFGTIGPLAIAFAVRALAIIIFFKVI
jgi:hypothetical protein